jgi:hypothetical protein
MNGDFAGWPVSFGLYGFTNCLKSEDTLGLGGVTMIHGLYATRSLVEPVIGTYWCGHQNSTLATPMNGIDSSALLGIFHAALG